MSYKNSVIKKKKSILFYYVARHQNKNLKMREQPLYVIP